MAAPNLGTAASQLALMLQKVQPDVENSQNLDSELDKMFSDVKAEDMGLEKYRHPIQVEVGGTGGSYQPDGGSYFQGQGAKTDQFIVAPVPVLVVFSATELLRRLSQGGKDVTVYNSVARMISDAHEKAAHYRNAYLQGYNNGILATVDASYAGGNTIQLATVPFGARLININDALQVTDANMNVVGTVNVLDVQNTSVGGIDTITVDAAPGGMAAGYNLIPIGLASGTPIGWQGLNYIVNPTTLLEYCGVSRSLSYVQAPAFNANGATLTLGITSAFKTRMIQSLGMKRFSAKGAQWYGHPAQRDSAEVLGFAKSFYMLQDGKPANYDIGAQTEDNWMLCGMKVVQDSIAAIDKLYWLNKSNLRRVRYPGSQKFIPGLQDGLWWPRTAGGLYLSEYDLMFQDSFNAYSKLPRQNGVIHNLGLQASLGNAA